MPTIDSHSRAVLNEILRAPSITRLRTLLSDPTIDWFNILELSGDRLVTPAVSRIVCIPDLIPLIPDDVVDALQLIRQCNLTRNQRLIETFVRVVSVLNQANVYPLPLKGIFLLLNDTHIDQAERLVSDIDLLIHPSELEKSLDLLAKHGFVQRCNPFLGDEGHHDNRFEAIVVDDFRHKSCAHNYHIPPIKENLDAEFCIEIHTRPCSANHAMETELSSIAFQCSDVAAIGDCQYRQPGLTFTLMHTAHHMLIQDKLLYLGVTDYRHLMDIDRLLKQIVDSGETSQLLERAESVHFRDLFTFVVWLCGDSLDIKYKLEIPYSPTGEKWIADFKITSKSPVRRKIRNIVSTTKIALPRLLSSQALHQAFGDMELRKAAPLYVRYQYKRALKAIRSRFS